MLRLRHHKITLLLTFFPWYYRDKIAIKAFSFNHLRTKTKVTLYQNIFMTIFMAEITLKRNKRHTNKPQCRGFIWSYFK